MLAWGVYFSLFASSMLDWCYCLTKNNTFVFDLFRVKYVEDIMPRLKIALQIFHFLLQRSKVLYFTSVAVIYIFFFLFQICGYLCTSLKHNELEDSSQITKIWTPCEGASACQSVFLLYIMLVMISIALHIPGAYAYLSTGNKLGKDMRFLCCWHSDCTILLRAGQTAWKRSHESYSNYF